MMNSKVTKTIIYVFVSLIIGTASYAETLFESDWSYATGTSANAVTDGGVWTDWERNDHSTTWYQVRNDGTAPGGRNYIECTRGPQGNSALKASSAKSFGNPSNLFFRVWFRLNPNWEGIEHFIRLRSSYSTNDSNDVYIMSIRNNINGVMSVGFQSPAVTPYMLTGKTITDNRWHMWEVRVVNAGTSRTSFYCRFDGEDVTSAMREKNRGTYLTSVNGTFTTSAMNYQRWELYDDGGSLIHLLDLTGLKITDGPTWIGGNGPDNPENLSIIGSSNN